MLLQALIGLGPLLAAYPPVWHRPVAPAPTALAERVVGKFDLPVWARDARWYYVDVARFHNGEKSNDPPDTRDWTTEWPGSTGSAKDQPSAAELDARSYGGDLQGLRARLPYLKELGVNTLLVGPILLRTLPGSPTGPDPQFAEIVKEAHKAGFRVVLWTESGQAAQAHEDEIFLLNTMRHWLDAFRDNEPSEGIDGWLLRGGAEIRHKFWKEWRLWLKAMNRQALLIADVRGDPSQWLAGDELDVVINDDASEAIARFFANPENYPVQKFFDDLADIRKRQPLELQLAAPTSLGSLNGPRPATVFSTPHATGNGPAAPADKPAETAGDALRLALAFQHCYVGAPLTYYGDEAGMLGGAGALRRAPMWWPDLPDTSSRPPTNPGDLRPLLSWLHLRRELHAPLRYGEFRTVLLDEPRRLLAFSRFLPGDEVIVVINYGSTKQEVTLHAGRPGQLIGVLIPQLKPAQGKDAVAKRDGLKFALIRMNGSRQFVSDQGDIHFWIGPMSLRLVLISDKEPR